MTVELICVGTEILMGNIVNTNSAYLARQCARLGLSVYYQSVVGDNEERLAESIRQAIGRSDITILTGGLGPTPDDLTKEVAAKVMGMPLEKNQACVEMIKRNLSKTSFSTIPSNNWKQAMVPKGAVVLMNSNGTAPGLILEKDGKEVILLPGPPGELTLMFEEQVMPYLAKKQPGILYSEMVKVCGIGESRVAEKIDDLIATQTNPTIATYAKESQVDIRVTAKGKNEKEAKALVKPLVKELKERFQEAVFTTKEEVSIEEALVELCIKKGITLSTAESCTGGLIAGRLVNVSGVSDVFPGGMVTYSNSCKHKMLGVKKETLKDYGAVSKRTAKEMAKGICKAMHTDVGIAVTGIAGPAGGTKKKPVGLVYISCCYQGNVTVEKYIFKGNRKKVRENTVVRALDLARRCILHAS